MAWPQPQYTKNRVREAGKRIEKSYVKHGYVKWGDVATLEDSLVLENWRTSHGAVLNTAQAWLRRLDKLQRPVVGQRLKRQSTIVDKLGTKRSRDLSTMHDIAGVRAIFKTLDELNDFREQMRKSRALHKIIHDENKYNYIENPKSTGYRGIHEVLERQVSSDSGAAWNGLKFEVQLRTSIQHAWATAVEIFDDTQNARFKFSKDETPAYRQFLIASELFARIHEKSIGCLTSYKDTDLVDEFNELESKTHTVKMIHSLHVASNYTNLRENSILQRTIDGRLVVRTYESLPNALSAISEIENHKDTLNAVLVGSKTPAHIRDAFRNYFEDTQDFVDLLRTAIKEIRPSEKLNF